MYRYLSEKKLQLYYYIFFSIMVINQFLPNDAPKKVSAVLGIVGFLFVITKILFTDYTKKEFTIIFLIGVVSVISFFTSRREGLLFTALAIVGLKNIDVKKCVEILLKVGGIVFIVVILRYILINGLSNELSETRYIFGMNIEVYKTTFGYNHANRAFLLFSTLVLSFIYLNYGKVSKIQWGVIIGLSLVMFYYTFSRTGFIVILFSFIYYFVLESKLFNINLLKKLLCSVPLLSVLASFVLPYLYKFGNLPLISEINKMMADRISLSYEFLNFFTPKLLGRYVDDVSQYLSTYNKWYLVCDNSYVMILCAYGIIAFLLFIYSIYKISCMGVEDKSKLFVLSSFCVYGIAEAFFVIVFTNFAMLFIKDVLYKSSNNVGEDIISIKKFILGGKSQW